MCVLRVTQVFAPKFCCISGTDIHEVCLFLELDLENDKIFISQSLTSGRFKFLIFGSSIFCCRYTCAIGYLTGVK